MATARVTGFHNTAAGGQVTRRARKSPHELGYRLYRGYIWRRSAGDIVSLWNPVGQFICMLPVRDIPRYVDKSIKFGWERPAIAPMQRFEQLALI